MPLAVDAVAIDDGPPVPRCMRSPQPAVEAETERRLADFVGSG